MIIGANNPAVPYFIVPSGNQDSSKGGAVETGCSDLHDVI